MIASRAVLRSTATARSSLVRSPVVRSNLRHARFDSTTSTQREAAKVGGGSGLVGGLAGGALVFLAGYGYYHFSGAKTIVNTASATKKKFDSIAKSMSEQTPEPNELLKWFRQTVSSYATFIPGAKQYTDSFFNDLDSIEQKHRGEVNEIVKSTYHQLRDATKSGLSADTAYKSYAILEDAMKKLGDLAQDSMSEILDNHPEVKNKVGGNIDQLKNMTNSYGPDAKKQVDQTYGQIKDILAGGIGIGTIDKIRKLVEEKMQQMKKLGDEAWKKGLEEAKPYLDKNPQIKEMLEKNKDVLQSGNLTELWEKVRGGNADQLNDYIKQATETAKGSGMSKIGDITSKIQQLQDLMKNKGDDAQKLLKETYSEVSSVLQKKTQEAEKLAKK